MCNPQEHLTRVYPEGLGAVSVCQARDNNILAHVGSVELALNRSGYLGNSTARVRLRRRSET